MLISMTGFSSKSVSMTVRQAPVTMLFTVKSLNGRFLDVNVRLPFTLSACEAAIIERCRQKLIRGTVFVSVQSTTPGALRGAVLPNMTMIEGYLAAQKTVQASTKIAGELTIADIFDLPGVFEGIEELADETLVAQLISTLDQLLDDVIKERTREGASLEADMRRRIAILSEKIEAIAPRAEEVVEQRKKELLTKLQETIATLQHELKDQQVTLLLQQVDRAAIHEEIVRFKTHLERLTSCLTENATEKGKRIDFIIQELFREINTITAKCIDSQISGDAITIKVELEKLKEQAQNLL